MARHTPSSPAARARRALLRTLWLAALFTAFLAHQQRALAQNGKATLLEEETVDDDDDDEGTVTMGSDDAPVGASENPDATPEFGRDTALPKGGEKQPVETRAYPLELIHRPLTLERNMFEARIDLPMEVEFLQLQSQLRIAYGITDKIHIGLGYGGGTLANHDDYDPFIVGKTVQVEGRYQLTRWASVQLRVPMYVDPFAMGIVVGAPMKFRFFGKLALTFGEDFLTVKTYRFAPELSDSIYNEDRVGDINTNTVTSDGELRFLATAHYQYSPKTTISTEFGFIALNFSSDDAAVPLRTTVNYSPNPKMDLYARVGFNNLDRATDEFGLMLGFALRI